MRIATMTSLFREQRGTDEYMSYIDSMRRCKAAGFDIQDFNMCAMLRRKTELNNDDWMKQADKIRDEAEKLGIEFVQSHPPYRPNKYGYFKTEEEEEFFKEITRRSIVISGMLGVKWAVLHPVTECVKTEYNFEADLALNHEIFDEVVELAMKEKVGIAFENMADRDSSRRFGATAHELIELIDSYHDERVGICWDTGHANRIYIDPVAPMKEVGKRIKALHINDNHGDKDEHLLPFEGTISWEQVMKVLVEIGYEGDLVYEIKTNNYMPDGLKDQTARFAAEVGRYLLSLCK